MPRCGGDGAAGAYPSVRSSDGVARDELVAAAAHGARTGRPAALRVLEAADPRAATPDLVDRGLRIALECDSWTYHAEKSAFRWDLERYHELALDGWLVLRVDRRHVVEHPTYVRDLLVRAVARRR